MNKIVVSIIIAILAVATMFLGITRTLPQITSKNWVLNAGSKIATSNAFPKEFGGLTVLDNSVYVSLENGMFYRLDHDSKTLWSFQMQDYSIYPPTEDNDTTYITGFDGRLYAVDTKTGSGRWRFTTPNLVMADTEPVVSGSIVLFGSRNGVLYALDKHTGQTKWTFQTTPIDTMRVIFDEPIIHFGRFTADQASVYLNSATDNSLYALDLSTGTIIWSLKNYGFFYQKPILQEDSVSLQNNKGMLLTINKKTGHIISEIINNPGQSDMQKFADATIDAQNSRRLGDIVYALTKDHVHLVKLSRQQANANISTFTKKVLKNKPYISRKTKQSQAIIIHPQETKAEKNTVYALTITHDDSPYTNPQKDISIRATFTSPQKTQCAVFGFYYDKNTWQIRFTPNQTGTWHWSVGQQRGSFEVIDSTQAEFMRISTTQPKMFTTGNTVFVPLGLQDCVKDYNQNGDPLDQWFPGLLPRPSENEKAFNSSSMETYMSLYQQAGFNLWRYGVGNCSRSLWLEMGHQGNRYSLNESIRVDQLFSSLKSHNFHILMSLLSFELPFATNLTIQEKQNILEDYLRYVVARYAAYVDIWELANEIHMNDDTVAFMTKIIREIDPYHHPITTNWERPNNPNIEINSLHWYDQKCDAFCNRNLDLQVAKYTNLDKPTVFSEQGNRDANWDEHSADRMRVRLWIGFFKNISPIYWNSSQSYYISEFGASNIYLGPTERIYTSVFSSIIQNANVDMQGARVISETEGVKVFGQSSQQTTLIYLYRQINNPEFTSATIQIDIPSSGAAQWIDPKTGKILLHQHINKGNQKITTPPFGTDIVFIVRY